MNMWNLSESELLLATVQLSISFAGFASLASVLRQRSAGDHPRLDASRLLNMLTISLAVAALALLPLLPMSLAWSPRWVWGSAGAVGVVAIPVVGWTITRRTMGTAQDTGFSRTVTAVNYALAASAFAGFSCSLAGFPVTNSFAAYFGGLVALSCICGVLFYRVIASLLKPDAPGPH